GDLTWNKELALVCPVSLIDPVDVYVTSHHGLEQSGSPALLSALHPRVAIMNNGATKGGSPQAWQIVKNSRGLEDLWQGHYSVEGGATHNVATEFIANPDEACKGKTIELSAALDGSFTVTNTRTGFRKKYPAKAP
ncbi:MAG: MBL fold metallo-hydrolase, partial [Bryobacteraceae bacterium]